MSSSWPVVRLGEVLRLVDRQEAVELTSSYRLLGVRLDAKGAFLRETVIGSETSAPRLNRVESGDFIYSRLFAWRGAFGVIGDDLEGCFVSGEFPIFRSKDDSVDLRFLFHWFRLPRTLQVVADLCTGSTPLTRNRFKEEFFLGLEIPLPPLDEQRRIVSRIEEVATRVEAVRRLHDEQSIAAKAFVISKHEDLANGRELELSEFLELHEEQVSITPDGTYPQAGMRSFGQGLFAKDAVLGSGTTYRAFNRLYDGAIVLSQVKGWEGAISVCPEHLAGRYVSPEYRTFRCKRGKALPDYLKFVLPTEWFWGRLGSATRGQGARRERTRPEQFLRIKVSMPEIEKQEDACKSFQTVHRALLERSSLKIHLEALLPSILDRAFRGEL